MRWFGYVHYSDVDHAGHAHGVGSPEYAEAIRQWDRRLTDVVARAGDAQILILTDHGLGNVWKPLPVDLGAACPATGTGNQHHACPDVWAVSSPALEIGPRLLDVAAAVRRLLHADDDDETPTP